MKMFIRFGCGDILETDAKEVGGGDYRIVTPEGPMYVGYRMVFKSRKEAEANCHESKLARYKQVFRKPIKITPFKQWTVDRLDGPIVLKPNLKRGDLAEFLSVLEPNESYYELPHRKKA